MSLVGWHTFDLAMVDINQGMGTDGITQLKKPGIFQGPQNFPNAAVTA